jgi:hypothetical protein
MDGLERKMPSTIDYSDVLPMSVPAVSRRRKFYPVNGGEFRAEANNEIRIPIDSTSALLDAAHSYLEFSIRNSDPAASLSLDAGGAAMFFTRVRVEQQGKVLSDTQEYNRLVASVINPCTETGGGRLAGSIRDSTQAGQGDIYGNEVPYGVAFNRGDRKAFANHGNGTKIQVGIGTYTFSMPILTGLFTQDKLIPLPLVDKANPLTLVLNMETEENLGVWVGGAPAARTIAITQVCYNAQLVEVGGDVIQQFSMMRDMMGGQLAISGQDWEHSAFFLTGGAAGGGGQRVVNLPVRKRSIKSLFWVANSDDLGNTAGPIPGKYEIFNKSFGGHCNIDSWQLKVGSVTYPPTPIEGPGNGGLQPSQHTRGECLKELAKAMGTLSFVNPTGAILNTITYCGHQGAAAGATQTATGDNGIGGLTLVAEASDSIYVAPFGIDLESFQHTAMESGVDSETMALDTNLLLNINSVAGTIGGEDKTIHSWFCFDKHYYFNADGSVSMSD